MPLTALLADRAVLDLSSSELSELSWESIYRARPRAALTCRECGHGVHAKRSRLGMRFFAHDRGAPECSLVGESMAHRLLKVELAAAIRDAGWVAELEVPGTGWRADVLATSPDGVRRMAWEAQLASTTADDLAARTRRMAAEGVLVCWVGDKRTPWMGHVPSVRIEWPQTPADGPDSALAVVAGLGQFIPQWCERRRSCDRSAVPYGRPSGRCGGHGRWQPLNDAMPLRRFVVHVLSERVRSVLTRAPHIELPVRDATGPLLWTTWPHLVAEQEQVVATTRREEWLEEQEAHWRRQLADQEAHIAALAALLQRQKDLLPHAVELVRRRTGGYVGVRDPDEVWARGVPLFVADLPEAVISPVAGRVDKLAQKRLAGVTVVVASPEEQRRLAKVCAPGQRFHMFDLAATPSRDAEQDGSRHEGSGGGVSR